MNKEIEKLKQEKENLVLRIIKLKEKYIELDKRIYKALKLIEEKQGYYDIPTELIEILEGGKND